jgi:hypothetical protein
MEQCHDSEHLQQSLFPSSQWEASYFEKPVILEILKLQQFPKPNLNENFFPKSLKL